MKITVKPYLLKRRQRPDGTIPIYFRITQNRNYSLIYSGIDIEEEQWNPKKREVTNTPSAPAFNYQLNKLKNEIDAEIIKCDGIPKRLEIAEKFYQKPEEPKLSEKVNLSFRFWAEQYAESLNKENKYHPYKQTLASSNKLIEFSSEKILLNQITPKVLEDFQEWLTVSKKNHNNTIIKNLERIKRIFEYAIDNGIDVVNPFKQKFKKVEAITNIKKALTIDQIKTLNSLELPEGSELWHVRNYFMFSFWTAGNRFTDLALLRWKSIKDGRIIYRMGKNETEKSQLLLPEAIKILDYYKITDSKQDDFIFPLLEDKNQTLFQLKKKASSKNVTVNRLLKELQEMAGIDTNLTFHIARHSLARWLYSSKMSIELIASVMGHKNRLTTEIYLEGLRDYTNDEELKRITEEYNK